MDRTAPTLYDLAGGASAMQALVNVFYDKVQQNKVLRPLFPDDFDDVKKRQYMFLTQFFGGPPLFSQTYGAPMMRARHMKAAIAPRHAKEWLACMSESLQEVGIQGPLFDVMMDRFTKAGYQMVNHTDEGAPLVAPQAAITGHLPQFRRNREDGDEPR
ncbi:globin [Alicyclobacillus pomorum]|uniref:globin domain-containing protein n=1 Tax=Alicyclobacillus pomorum TaxID=204470 RepID=UPI001FE14048|nr:globin [Alicyclobacillus pomorum]